MLPGCLLRHLLRRPGPFRRLPDAFEAPGPEKHRRREEVSRVGAVHRRHQVDPPQEG